MKTSTAPWDHNKNAAVSTGQLAANLATIERYGRADRHLGEQITAAAMALADAKDALKAARLGHDRERISITAAKVQVMRRIYADLCAEQLAQIQ